MGLYNYELDIELEIDINPHSVKVLSQIANTTLVWRHVRQLFVAPFSSCHLLQLSVSARVVIAMMIHIYCVLRTWVIIYATNSYVYDVISRRLHPALMSVNWSGHRLCVPLSVALCHGCRSPYTSVDCANTAKLCRAVDPICNKLI